LTDNTTIRIGKDIHTEILKVIDQIQDKLGKIPTLDDALKELLENYKKKSKLTQVAKAMFKACKA